MGYTEKTIEHHRLNLLKIKKYTRGYPTQQKLLQLVASYRKRYSTSHVNNMIKTIRRFFGEYLGRKDMISLIRYPRHSSTLPKYTPLPTVEDLRKVFNYLQSPLDRALFLFYATTGLRRSEVLKLKKSDILWKDRAVIPAQYRITKKTGITFFNHETEAWLRYYLSGSDDSELLFNVTGKHFQKLWRRIKRDTGVEVTPQVLRKWFAVEMRKRGVPDSFIDIFQGRMPRSVLAQYYTPIGVRELKEVYDKAGLEIGVPLPDINAHAPYTIGGQNAEDKAQGQTDDENDQGKRLRVP
ncbi:MAG: tyrosine-type recombinase/integrase [Candidatus Diapherotrites archaeon]|nr:tyrosine-type recombinase/integrase [Candidatus Diapherotrites archaeon]